MKKTELVIIADYSQEMSLTLEELCQICGIPHEFVIELIQYEIITPKGMAPFEWTFTMTHLQRVKMVKRLQKDLEMTIPSIAVVVDLLDQIAELKARIALMEKHAWNV